MQAYRLLFHRLYAWGLRHYGPGDLPAYNAIVGLSTLATMNAFSIAIATELMAGRRLLLAEARWSAVAVWLVALVLHGALLVWGDRADRIREEFESDASSPGAKAFCWIYPAASLLVFFSLLVGRG